MNVIITLKKKIWVDSQYENLEEIRLRAVSRVTTELNRGLDYFDSLEAEVQPDDATKL